MKPKPVKKIKSKHPVKSKTLFKKKMKAKTHRQKVHTKPSKTKTKRVKIWDMTKMQKTLKLPPKAFFQRSISKLKKLKKDELKVLVSYKRSGYNILNQILYLKKMPYIIMDPSFSDHPFLMDSKTKTKTTKKATKKKKPTQDASNASPETPPASNLLTEGEPRLTSNKVQYIFPDDAEKIKEKYTQYFVNYINILDRIFSKMSYLPDIVLYRGVRLPSLGGVKGSMKKKKKTPETTFRSLTDLQDSIKKLKKKQFESYDKKETIHNEAYWSTTLHPSVAIGFSGGYFSGGDIGVMKIHVKATDKVPFVFLTDRLFSESKTAGAYKKKLSTWDKTPHDEFEILLPRNFTCKVIKKEVIHIEKGIRGFSNVYAKEKTLPVTVYEMISLPYKPPTSMEESYFQEKPSYVCF